MTRDITIITPASSQGLTNATPGPVSAIRSVQVDDEATPAQTPGLRQAAPADQPNEEPPSVFLAVD